MKLLEINSLNAEEVASVLPCFDGITPTIAKKLSAYVKINGIIRNQEQLFILLKEFGLNTRYVEGLKKIIKVDPFNEEEIPFNPNQGEFIDFETPIDNRPIVFIPGLLASHLRKPVITKKGILYKRIWPPFSADGVDKSIKDLTNFVENVGAKNLKTGQGIVLNAYADLIDSLGDRGYKVINGNLLIFNYNWFLSAKTNGELLNKAINEFIKNFNRTRRPKLTPKAEKVDVICHSTGGLITRSAIKFNEAKINKTVYIGVPHFGTTKAYFFAHSKIPITDKFLELFFKLFGNKKDFKKFSEAFHTIARLSQSFFDLMPYDNYLNKSRAVLSAPRTQGSGLERKVGVEQTYKTGDWGFSKDLIEKIDEGRQLRKDLGTEIPGDHLIVYSKHKETLDTVQFTGRKFKKPTASKRKGDGTIPTFSGSGGKGEFNKNSKRLEVNATHVELPNNSKVINEIFKYLGLFGFIKFR